MLATLIMESIAVRTQSPVTTVFPAPHVTLALSPLAEVWNKQQLKNRFELLLTICVHLCEKYASGVHYLKPLSFYSGLQAT